MRLSDEKVNTLLPPRKGLQQYTKNTRPWSLSIQEVNRKLSSTHQTIFVANGLLVFRNITRLLTGQTFVQLVLPWELPVYSIIYDAVLNTFLVVLASK